MTAVIETWMSQLTDPKTVCKQMLAVLKSIDASCSQEERRYLAACTRMKSELSQLNSPCVEEYLAALEQKYASDILYAVWQGFGLNRAIFQNPVNALMLNADYEELVQERRMACLPAASRAMEVIEGFISSVPKEKLELLDAVSDFYSYLQTYGYKIAHYLGFRFADAFLPCVIPGYHPDSVHTDQYTISLGRDLSLNIGYLM